MELSEFMYLINLYGEDKLIGLVMDNSSRKFFKKGEFSIAKNMPDPTIPIIVFEDVDLKGVPVISTTTLGNVQKAIFVKDVADFDKINLRYIGA